jgi:hypothetical protein
MAKKAPAAAVVEEDDVELDEIGEVDDTEEAAPAKSKAKAAAKAPKPEDNVWGVRALIALIKEKTDKEYNPREVRTLLRKLAREGGGVEREIVAGNKTRYEWTGPEDPEVRAILKAVKGGAIEESKKAALDKLKADKAAKAAAKPAPAAKAKAKSAPVADEDDEDED